MTVKDLKKQLEGLDDNLKLCAYNSKQDIFKLSVNKGIKRIFMDTYTGENYFCIGMLYTDWKGTIKTL